MALPIWRRKHLNEALKKAEALVAAANGDNSVCGCFEIHPFHPHWDKTTVAEIQEGIRLYVDTWIVPELKRALDPKQFH